jgi:branched-chain amino acid transport system substrate-binding protein
MGGLKRRATLALAALFLATFVPSTPIRAADPFVIDAIASLTGPSTFVGRGTAEGLAAAEQIVNKAGGIEGRPVKFLVHNDESNPQLTVQLFNQILTEHPAVVLASTYGAGCRAIFPLTTGGPVTYCMTPAVAPAAGSYDFSAGVANKDLMQAAIRFFHKRNWTRIATITATDATGQDNDAAIDAILALPENRGVTLADREHFTTTDLTVNAQLAHIKSSDAQVLIIGTAGTPTGTIMRGITEVGLTLPVGINYGNATRPQMTQLAPYLPKELYFFGTAFLSPATITDPKTKAAVDQYYATLKSLGAVPDASQLAGYDSGMLVLHVLQTVGLAANATTVRDALANVSGWVGANGPYDFKAYPQRGLGASAAVICRWDPQRAEWTAVSKAGGDPLR